MFDWFTVEHLWVLVGFLGQGLFMSRFAVQWWASEKAGRSVVPVMFWYFSIGGGIILLIYRWINREVLTERKPDFQGDLFREGGKKPRHFGRGQFFHPAPRSTHEHGIISRPG